MSVLAPGRCRRSRSPPRRTRGRAASSSGRHPAPGRSCTRPPTRTAASCTPRSSPGRRRIRAGRPSSDPTATWSPTVSWPRTRAGSPGCCALAASAPARPWRSPRRPGRTAWPPCSACCSRAPATRPSARTSRPRAARWCSRGGSTASSPTTAWSTPSRRACPLAALPWSRSAPPGMRRRSRIPSPSPPTTRPTCCSRRDPRAGRRAWRSPTVPPSPPSGRSRASRPSARTTAPSRSPRSTSTSPCTTCSLCSRWAARSSCPRSTSAATPTAGGISSARTASRSGTPCPRSSTCCSPRPATGRCPSGSCCSAATSSGRICRRAWLPARPPPGCSRSAG